MSSGISLRYDPIEDRLVLTCTTQDGAAQELHLTRRFMRMFAKRLAAIAAQTAQAPAGVDRGQRENLAALHHDAQAGKVAIEKSETRSADAGVRPLLVTGVRTGRLGGQRERWVVEFRGDGSKPVRLALSVRMMHGFIELLRRRLPATDWGIELLAEPADERHKQVMH